MDDKHILVVEDDESLRSALVQKLQHDKFSVITAENGEEGLKAALESRPDLILLDLFMPKMDGAEMMDRLRTDSWGAHVPIIVLTNYNADDNIIQKVTKDHPSYYLLKVDTSPEDLVQKIKEVLSVQ